MLRTSKVFKFPKLENTKVVSTVIESRVSAYPLIFFPPNLVCEEHRVLVQRASVPNFNKAPSKPPAFSAKIHSFFDFSANSAPTRHHHPQPRHGCRNVSSHAPSPNTWHNPSSPVTRHCSSRHHSILASLPPSTEVIR